MSEEPDYTIRTMSGRILLEPDYISAGVDRQGRLCLCLEKRCDEPIGVVLCDLEDTDQFACMLRDTAALFTAPEDASEIAPAATSSTPTPRDVFGGGRA